MRAVRGRRVILISLATLALALVAAAGVGTVRIPPLEVIRIFLSALPGVELVPDWADTHEAILWNIRFPRVVMAVLAGMALSLAGAGYQALFKNPLADPYVLGVSAGAAVGASGALALADRLRHQWVGPVPVAAFLGGLLAIVLVYRLAIVGRRVPVIGLLLAGVAVGSFCMAIVSLILFLTTPVVRDAIIFWMMGGLYGASWLKVGWLVPYVLAGLALLLYHGRELNAMLLGEEAAQHMGVDVERLKRITLVAGALLTAATVAFCGSIGFVGLIVPHVVRFLVGPDHRYLLPASGVVGGAVLLAADTLARSAFGATEVPVGLVMSLLGGPFFLWLLRRKLQPS